MNENKGQKRMKRNLCEGKNLLISDILSRKHFVSLFERRFAHR